MSLLPGARLGVYEVVAKLGEGGMGEVYRVRDTTLDRDVALKILPESFARDPDRLMRFEREAKTLASLNHPNIAAIYGFESPPEGGRHPIALVMELVEGEDLSARIVRGPIPFDEALPIARQIAEALEAAHEQGIIHRDLKPANVKVRPDAAVKVLDFGLAKAMEPGAGSREPSAGLADSPTIISPAMTMHGMILGTAAYMAPEQAKGRAVDKRADIWAFGAVLYEMLSGARAFSGADVSDLLVAVLSKEVDFSALPIDTPRTIVTLIRSCLERDPKNRLRDIGDARLALVAARVAATNELREAAVAVANWRRRLPWTMAAAGVVLGLAGAGVALMPRPAGSMPVSHLAIPLPADATLFVRSYPSRAVAISADGSTIAYVTRESVPDSRIRVRRLDAPEFQLIPGSERGRSPFFSPDGAWLAFFDTTEGALKKASVRGGPAVTLQRGLGSAGWSLGTWCDDGRIVIDTWNDGLRVMSADGGDMRVLTQPGDVWHLDPQPLPGGCRILYYSQSFDGHAIEAISADGGTPLRILDNASHGRYLVTGHLLFVRDDALHIVPFDADRLKATGTAVPVPIEAVPDWFGVSAPTPQLDVSRNGTLVYAPRAPERGQESMLVAVSPNGSAEDVAPATFRYPALMLSPNGEQLAISGRDVGNARLDVIDLRRRATSTLVDLGKVDYPAGAVWAPDGRALYYTRYGPVSGEIVRHVVGSRGPDEVVLRLPGTWLCAWSISPDGRWLVISKYDRESRSDLFRVDLAAAPGTAAVHPLAASSASDEDGATISPDAKWVTYVADSGRGWDLFVERFPDGGQKTRLSELVEGVPVWSADGREIYFRSAGTGTDVLDVMAVRVETTPTLQAGQPRRLFSARYLRNRALGRSMILAPDGRRLLMVRTPPDPSLSNNTGYASQLNVVQNWFEELRTKVLK